MESKKNGIDKKVKRKRKPLKDPNEKKTFLTVAENPLMGRPTEYTPDFIPIVKNLMAQGASIYEICLELQKSRQCINEWREKYKDFGDAFKLGKDFSRGWWEREGHRNLENRDFNARLYELNMQNRHGWSSKRETKVAHSLDDSLSRIKDAINPHEKDF